MAEMDSHGTGDGHGSRRRRPEAAFLSMPPARRTSRSPSPSLDAAPPRRPGGGGGVAFASMGPDTTEGEQSDRGRGIKFKEELHQSWDGAGPLSGAVGGGEAGVKSLLTKFGQVGEAVSTAERWKKKMAERAAREGKSMPPRLPGAYSHQPDAASPGSAGAGGRGIGKGKSMFASMASRIGIGSAFLGSMSASSTAPPSQSRPPTDSAAGAPNSEAEAPKRSAFKAKMQGVRAFAGHAAAYEEEEEEPKTLASILAKNKAKIKTMAILGQTASKAEDIKVNGVQLEDLPFVTHGGRQSFKEKMADAKLQYYILREQLSSLFRLAWAVSFYLFATFLTVSCLYAIPDWDTEVSQRGLMAAFTSGGLRLGGPRAQDTFWEIGNTDDVMAWMRGPLIDALYPLNSSIGGGVAGVIGQGRFALLSNVTLRQLRIRADSCAVPPDFWLKPGQQTDDMILAEADLTKYTLFSRELSLGAYILDCTKTLPAPLGNPGCGMVQEYSGHWFAAWPRGQVGTVAGCYSPSINQATQAKSNYGPIDLSDVESPTYNYSRWTWTDAGANGESEGSKGRWGDWYPGDGYVLDMGKSREEATQAIQGAESGDWIDLSTRAIFATVRVYSPSSESMLQLVLSIETKPGGGATPWARAESLHRSDVDVSAAWGGALEVHIVTFILTLIFLFFELYDLYKKGFVEVLSEQYHLQDTISYLLYIIGFSARLSALSHMEFPPPEPELGETPQGGMLQAVLAMKMWRTCLAINILFTYLRVVRTAPNVPYLRRIYLTLNRMIDLIVSSLACLMLAIVAYSLAFHMGFGQDIVEFRSLAESFFTSLRMIRGGVGEDFWERLWDVNRLLGPFFYLSWSIIGALVTVGMFAAAEEAALMDVSQDVPPETLNQYFAKLATSVLLERERRKNIFSQAAQAHVKKKERTEGKGGEKDVLAAARAKMTGGVKTTPSGKPSVNISGGVHISRPGGKKKKKEEDVEAEGDGWWTKFLMNMAGYKKEDVIEERVQVEEYKLRDLEAKMGEISTAVAALNAQFREEMGDDQVTAEAGQLLKGALGSHGQNRHRSPTSKPSSPSGKASIWQNAGKSTPDGHSHKKKKKVREELHLSTATEHHKKHEVEKADVGIQRTALNFRAVDAKGAAKLREQLSAHHTH